MNCSYIDSAVWDYFEDALDPTLRKEFESHISSCAACRQMVSEIGKFDSIIRESKNIAANPFLSTRVIGKLETQRLVNAHPRFFKLASIAQVFLIALALTTGFTFGIIVASAHQDKTVGIASQTLETQALRSELFVDDMLDEEKSIFQNPNP